MGDIRDIKCSEHIRVFEFLCDQCNLLLCPRCINIHLRENQNHICNHIEDIRHSLEKLNLNNSSTTINSNSNNSIAQSSSSKNSGFDSEIEELWKIIKRSSEEFELLHLKENEISDRFRSLHEYLVVEEHKFKKPITEDINNIIETINNNIDQLKSIINIVNISNNNSNDIKNSNNEEYVDGEGEIDSLSSPGTDKYTTDNIIKSIKESESIQKFIHNNKNSIFGFNQSILNEYKHMYNNDIDTIVLDLLFQHNRRHKGFNSDTMVKTVNNQFTLDINVIKEMISSYLEQKQLKQEQYINTSVNKQELAFSPHSKGATIFDMTNNTVLKEISVQYDFINSFTSMVNINNEYIYIFSPHHKKNQFCKYDIKNNIFYLIDDIKELKLLQHTTVCYDGKENIYFFGGIDNYSQWIQSYNVNTKQYISYSSVHFESICGSFFYRNQIYLVSYKSKSVYQFNLDKRIVRNFSNTANSSKNAICHDGNGNIYMLYTSVFIKEFIRFHIDTLSSTILSSLNINIPDRTYLSMVYHENNNNPTITLFGGADYGNHSYDITNDKWTKILENDLFHRGNCGTINFSI